MVTVFPSTIAPCRCSMLTATASLFGTQPLSTREPADVSKPAVQMMSFSPMGIPASGRSRVASSRLASRARASASAPSGRRRAQARIVPSSSSIRSRHAATSSSHDSTPVRSSRLAAAIVRAARVGCAHRLTESTSSKRTLVRGSMPTSNGTRGGRRRQSAAERPTRIGYRHLEFSEQDVGWRRTRPRPGGRGAAHDTTFPTRYGSAPSRACTSSPPRKT